MRPRDYFPLGIAANAAFCNRTIETNLLLENIKNGKHTLLMATRRYGKSSLILHVLKLSKMPYVETDLYMATNERVIEAYILNAVVELIGKALGNVEKLATSIKQYVKHLKPKLEIGGKGIKLELAIDLATDPATNVKEALFLLEQLLVEKNKQAVLLLDEFQTVGVIAQGKGIEAAIRHVAQKTKNLTIVFSGSNRKLLKTMFEDENRPLYKLCWKLSLQRIAAEHYEKHLQKAAMTQWNVRLSDTAFQAIITLSERHPYYMNKLCDRLWTFYEKHPPLEKDIYKEWHLIVEEEKSDAIKEISLLSMGQKAVLLYMMQNPNALLTEKESISILQMASSSILAAVDGLEEKDMIEKIDGRYQIINPVIRYYVVR